LNVISSPVLLSFAMVTDRHTKKYVNIKITGLKTLIMFAL